MRRGSGSGREGEEGQGQDTLAEGLPRVRFYCYLLSFHTPAPQVPQMLLLTTITISVKWVMGQPVDET